MRYLTILCIFYGLVGEKSNKLVVNVSLVLKVKKKGKHCCQSEMTCNALMMLLLQIIG